MQDNDEASVLGAAQVLDEVQQLKRMGNVQMVGRLVQEDPGRILRQCHGNPGTLQLPARELGESPGFQLGHFGDFKRTVAGCPIRCRWAAEPASMRKPPHQHQILNRKIRRCIGRLGQHGDLARKILLRPVAKSPACDFHIAGIWPVQTAHHFQGRRFAAAVRSAKGNDPAVGQVEADLVQRKGAVICGTDTIETGQSVRHGIAVLLQADRETAAHRRAQSTRLRAIPAVAR